MKFSIEKNPAALSIDAYSSGWIEIGGSRISESCIVYGSEVTLTVLPEQPEQLNTEHLAAILSREPELILLGTGPVLQFPDPGLTALASSNGVGLEAMDTRAACRVYNMLVGERRAVLAALFML